MVCMCVYARAMCVCVYASVHMCFCVSYAFSLYLISYSGLFVFLLVACLFCKEREKGVELDGMGDEKIIYV